MEVFMPIEEGIAVRGGIPLPIQCILMKNNIHNRPPMLHYHKYTELLFGMSGTAQVYTGSSHYLLGEGDLLLIHPREPHDVHAASESCTYIVIKFLPEVLLSGEQSSPTYGYSLLLTERTTGKQCFFSAGELAESGLSSLFAHLMEEWDGECFGYGEWTQDGDVILMVIEERPFELRINGDTLEMMEDETFAHVYEKQ
jgi:mannose-6-phosphate isomerase-like protein (cupin superfamily)